MKREIINIDEEKCNGCGNCVPNCHEGALQIIDGKAVLVSDLMCDGLGACLGHCPEDALTIEKREAEPYDEEKVMAEMVKKGKNVVVAHLKHLKDHNENEFLKDGIRYLWRHKDEMDIDPAKVVEEVHGLPSVSPQFKVEHIPHKPQGCPGSATREFSKESVIPQNNTFGKSALTHWPVQLHLINPAAAHFKNAELLIAADCSAFAGGDFHSEYLANRKLVIACPKLDHNTESYIQKFVQLIDEAKVNTITVLRMEVPCCGDLVQMVQMSQKQAKRNVPVKEIILSVDGKKLNEEWVI